MSSGKSSFKNTHRGVSYWVVADDEQDVCVISWVRVDLQGFPDMHDHDNTFPSKEAAWAAGEKMAIKLIDQVLDA